MNWSNIKISHVILILVLVIVIGYIVNKKCEETDLGANQKLLCNAASIVGSVADFSNTLLKKIADKSDIFIGLGIAALSAFVLYKSGKFSFGLYTSYKNSALVDKQRELKLAQTTLKLDQLNAVNKTANKMAKTSRWKRFTKKFTLGRFRGK